MRESLAILIALSMPAPVADGRLAGPAVPRAPAGLVLPAPVVPAAAVPGVWLNF